MTREDYNAKHRDYQRQQRIRERQSWRQFKSISSMSQERRAREEEKRQKAVWELQRLCGSRLIPVEERIR